MLALKAAESMIDPSRGGRITILYFKRSPIRLAHINYLLTQVITSPPCQAGRHSLGQRETG